MKNYKQTTTQSYLKYRWLFTSSGKLVIGGKNAEQNELLVKEIIKSGMDYIVMHTTNPGSPFTFLVDEGENVTEDDLLEQAVFTGCFSQEWKKQKKNTNIDIFHSKQITKNKGMKTGTFGVLGKTSRRTVELKLGLEVQEEKIRAVPRPRESLLWITPGEDSRNKAAKEIRKLLKEKKLDFTVEEIERGMPSGGIKIIE